MQRVWQPQLRGQNKDTCALSLQPEVLYIIMIMKAHACKPLS